MGVCSGGYGLGPWRWLGQGGCQEMWALDWEGHWASAVWGVLRQGWIWLWGGCPGCGSPEVVVGGVELGAA